MDKYKYGYKDPMVVDFYKVSDLLEYVQDNYKKQIDYRKIKFEHLPKKISLVVADKIPKDIFAYYSKDGFLEHEHIDLRKKNKKE